jgi:hypothetical protein|tara:strand:+ start:192 stop:545 length:354 start_codon:yes stop_codon:yes gene_type:complete
MSYLKIPLTGVALPGAQYFIIPKDNISYVIAGAAVGGLATVEVFLKNNSALGAAGDAFRIQFGQAAPAAGFSLVDAIQDTWVASPGNGVSVVGGIPATVSATGQALTFCTITGVTIV